MLEDIFKLQFMNEKVAQEASAETEHKHVLLGSAIVIKIVDKHPSYKLSFIQTKYGAHTEHVTEYDMERLNAV